MDVFAQDGALSSTTDFQCWLHIFREESVAYVPSTSGDLHREMPNCPGLGGL